MQKRYWDYFAIRTVGLFTFVHLKRSGLVAT